MNVFNDNQKSNFKLSEKNGLKNGKNTKIQTKKNHLLIYDALKNRIENDILTKENKQMKILNTKNELKRSNKANNYIGSNMKPFKCDLVSKFMINKQEFAKGTKKADGEIKIKPFPKFLKKNMKSSKKTSIKPNLNDNIQENFEEKPIIKSNFKIQNKILKKFIRHN